MLAAAACFAAPLNAHAQAEPEDEPEIIVTGTRIPRPDLASASPITSFGAEEIAAHGALQAEDFLNTLPQASPDFSRTANNPGDGTARVNLRGLGADRTMTLLNGRRMAPSGTEGAADLNNLPAAIIERIDVVTGGASAVYGSDAVAGVVNFITRDDFEGAEITAQFDTYDAGDGDVFNASAVWGASAFNERAHLLVYLDYLEREAVLNGDRAFSSVSISDDPETGELFPGGSAIVPSGFINGQIVNSVFVPSRIFEAGGTLRPPDPATDLYNFAPDNYLQVPLERWSGGAIARFQITTDLEGALELMYSGPRSTQQLAPSPFSGFIDVPIAADFFPASTQAHLETNFDPDGDGIASFRFSRRLSDVGPRQSVFERDTYRAAAGLHGVLGEWEWDGAYTYARNDTHSELRNDASISRILQGLLIDPLTGACVDPTGGCVPVNLFGPNTLSPEAANFIRMDDITEETRVEQHTVTVFAEGDVFALPAGALRASVGADWRRVSSVYEPSPALATGDSAGFTQSPAVAGAFEVREAFGEVLVPILAGAPFAHRLELEAGARFTEHSTAGSHWTWKYGLQWLPIEAVRVRGMVQRAVRAPNVQELYEAPRLSQEGMTGFDDFCAALNDPIANGFADVCVAQGMDPSQVGVFDPTGDYIADTVTSGNTALGPETADTLTFGADWEFGDPWRVRLSADYFEIELRDAILLADPIANCGAAANAGDAACALIHRDPSGFITLIESHPVNYSRAIVEGVDFGASADFDVPSWLRLTPDANIGVDVMATHYLRAASAASPAASLLNCVGYFGCGTYDLLGATTPEWATTTTLRYRTGPFSAMLRWRYVGPLDNSDAIEAEALGLAQPIMAIPEIDAVHYIDLALAYELGEHARFSVGVDNVFEQDPPLLASNQVQANTDPARYDVFGRRLFVRLSYRLN
jgi:iron complex outermembrane recepter protein